MIFGSFLNLQCINFTEILVKINFTEISVISTEINNLGYKLQIILSNRLYIQLVYVLRYTVYSNTVCIFGYYHRRVSSSFQSNMRVWVWSTSTPGYGVNFTRNYQNFFRFQYISNTCIRIIWLLRYWDPQDNNIYPD